MTPSIVAIITIKALVSSIAVVSSPVIITSASAATPATTPAFGIGPHGDFKIKITGHITEHVAPDIIKHIEATVMAMAAIPTATVAVVIVVPGHVPRNSG